MDATHLLHAQGNYGGNSEAYYSGGNSEVNAAGQFDENLAGGDLMGLVVAYFEGNYLG